MSPPAIAFASLLTFFIGISSSPLSAQSTAEDDAAMIKRRFPALKQTWAAVTYSDGLSMVLMIDIDIPEGSARRKGTATLHQFGLGEQKRAITAVVPGENDPSSMQCKVNEHAQSGRSAVGLSMTLEEFGISCAERLGLLAVRIAEPVTLPETLAWQKKTVDHMRDIAQRQRKFGPTNRPVVAALWFGKGTLLPVFDWTGVKNKEQELKRAVAELSNFINAPDQIAAHERAAQAVRTAQILKLGEERKAEEQSFRELEEKETAQRELELKQTLSGAIISNDWVRFSSLLSDPKQRVPNPAPLIGMPLALSLSKPERGKFAVALLRAGVPPKAPVKDASVNLLMYAAGNSSLELVKYLAETQKFPLNAQNSAGDTALGYAVSAGHSDIVDFLLNLGANHTLVSKADGTLLQVAEQQGFGAIADRLRKAGAKLPADR